MGTVYLHIGIYKTGSSALQVLFAQNADALLAQGLTYPSSASVSGAKRGLITSGNGAPLALALKPGGDKDARDRELAWFEDVLKGSGTPDILLSSEIFSELPAASFETLVALCGKHNRQLKIIAFVRDQASYLESLYIQHVKRRRITALPEAYIRSRYPKTALLKYHAFLSGIADAIGAENIAVRDYASVDVIAAACDIMGLDLASLQLPSKKINVSLPYFLVPMFLELNKMDPNMSFSDQVVRNQAQLQVHAAPEKRSLLSPEMRQEISSYFAKDTQKLSRDFFDGLKIFDAPPPPYISMEEASKVMDLRGVTQLLGGLAIQHERRLVRIEKALLALGNKAGLEPGWIRKITTD